MSVCCCVNSDKEEDAVMETNLISEGEDASPGDDGKEQDGDYASDPALIRLKKYFKKLESQKLESCRSRRITGCCRRRSTWRSLKRWRTFWRSLRFEETVVLRGGCRSWGEYRVTDCLLLLWYRHLRPFCRLWKTIGKEERAGQSVLHLVLHSGLVDVKASKEVLRKVSTMWEKTTVIKANLYSTAQLYTRHPRGHYLSDGAYKEVFKVYSLEQKRLEAISVMDIGDIGNQGVVRQEVAHSVLLSDACEHGICPNFLRIYDVFLAHEQPCPDRWYMRMEFCDGGDLEDFIGLQKNKVLPLDSVAVSFFFQMVFSLYCAREKFNLRHYDIKVRQDCLLLLTGILQL
ncbi:Protein kinase-like domain [Phytophthora cactorum]|nr:Protein kinase-like domain [Phytophthora cactorum]